MSVGRALANEQCCHEAAERAAALAELALAGGSSVINNSNGNSDGNGEDNRNGNYGTMVIIPYKNELNDSAQKGQKCYL